MKHWACVFVWFSSLSTRNVCLWECMRECRRNATVFLLNARKHKENLIVYSHKLLFNIAQTWSLADRLQIDSVSSAR